MFTGCVSPPIHSGFLSSYDGMTKSYSLDAVRVNPSADLNAFDTLYLAPVETKMAGSSISDVDKQAIAESLHKNFRMEMSKYFKNVTSDEGFLAGHKALKLQMALTELQPTDVAENLLIGFGAGNATASIEGRFENAATGDELIAFSDRKKGSPFTKKEFNAGAQFPNWSKLKYLYLFTEIWPENVGKIISAHKSNT